jgi:hypothetical protein
MHPYATDSSERRIVPLVLAVISIGAAWLLPKAFHVAGLDVPWWLDAPSVMGFYGLLHGAFDRWIWKWTPLCTIGLVRVPDLNGPWKYTIKSSFLNGKNVDARVTITQTWRSIHVRLDTDQSHSSSLIASLLIDNPNEYVLNYEFLNSPKQDAVETMHMHRGSAEIRFPKNGKILTGDGEYYSGRDRANQGSVTAERM